MKGKQNPDHLGRFIWLGAVNVVQDGAADTVIMLEDDLYRRAAKSAVDALLESAEHVVILDPPDNTTTPRWKESHYEDLTKRTSNQFNVTTG